jgi:hypothetical protein
VSHFQSFAQFLIGTRPKIFNRPREFFVRIKIFRSWQQYCAGSPKYIIGGHLLLASGLLSQFRDEAAYSRGG